MARVFLTPDERRLLANVTAREREIIRLLFDLLNARLVV